MTTELTATQTTTLETLKARIRANLKVSFEAQIEVGRALLQIEREELYKPHGSITAFALVEFEELTRFDVARYMTAATLFDQLGEVEKKPTNLGQTEALKKATEPAKVWRKVLDTGKRVSAKVISDAIGKPKDTKTSAKRSKVRKVTLFITTKVKIDELSNRFGEPDEAQGLFYYSGEVNLTDEQVREATRLFLDNDKVARLAFER